MELKISTLQKLCKLENIEITIHAAKRLEQRNISVNDILSCILTGEIIEQYPTDYPYPSCLISGNSSKNLILHVVVGSNSKTLWIITAYYPAADKWMPDFKTRKENYT